MAKDNSLGSQNKNQPTGNGNQRKQRGFKYSKFRANNKSVKGNSSPTNGKMPKRELKFFMHDSQQRKNAESFEKIKNAILLRIQETFEDAMYITESLEKSKKRVFVKPEVRKSELPEEEERQFEQDQFYEE